MRIRAFAVLAFVVMACKSSPPPEKPANAPKHSLTAEPDHELNEPCQHDHDCSGLAGATCMRGGDASTNGGRCRIVCKAATDTRCAAPNACLSSTRSDGAESYSCERTCTGDTDCHAGGYSCQHPNGPTQPGFCTPSPPSK